MISSFIGQHLLLNTYRDFVLLVIFKDKMSDIIRTASYYNWVITYILPATIVFIIYKIGTYRLPGSNSIWDSIKAFGWSINIAFKSWLSGGKPT